MKTPLFVTAVSTIPGLYYRMDGSIGAGGSLEWPAKDVLGPAKLPIDLVGVVTWYKRNGAVVFVPAAVSVSSDAPKNENISKIRLLMRSPRDLERVKLRIAKMSDAKCSAPGEWTQVLSRSIWSGSPFEVPLPPAVRGKACIEIRAKEEDRSDWLYYQLMVEFEP